MAAAGARIWPRAGNLVYQTRECYSHLSVPCAGRGRRNIVTSVLEGFRILEVAEHTFVPAASAILSDWGAEVIKVEPLGRGDAMRGLGQTGVIDLGGGDVHPLLEHSNRGRRASPWTWRPTRAGT